VRNTFVSLSRSSSDTHANARSSKSAHCDNSVVFHSRRARRQKPLIDDRHAPVTRRVPSESPFPA
jgi:hypothetical protein